jgi:hypothetical protein
MHDIHNNIPPFKYAPIPGATEKLPINLTIGIRGGTGASIREIEGYAEMQKYTYKPDAYDFRKLINDPEDNQVMRVTDPALTPDVYIRSQYLDEDGVPLADNVVVFISELK